MTSLDITLLYLLAAVLGVVACRSLELPPMLGYLVVGVLIGPNALAIAQDKIDFDMAVMRGGGMSVWDQAHTSWQLMA